MEFTVLEDHVSTFEKTYPNIRRVCVEENGDCVYWIEDLRKLRRVYAIYHLTREVFYSRSFSEPRFYYEKSIAKEILKSHAFEGRCMVVTITF